MPGRPPHPIPPSAPSDGESTTTTTTTPTAYDPPSSTPSQYVPYRPPNSDFTPPASPQFVNPHAGSAARKGFGSGRLKLPAKLHMDTAAPPAYERPVYSPSPSSSPPLPPLPSPKFALRQRTPSLFRHAATSSPLNNGYPRAEQPLGSPTFGPSQMRPPHSAGPTSDPRAIFNALGSNPVNRNSATWESGPEDIPETSMQPHQYQQRTRGMTSASQRNYHSNVHPPLRSATSIPDFGPVRSNDRTNLSGAYRPNRGGPNWSHNDHYPPRHFRGEEPRASYRSGFTTNSSIFMEASGTERSSMATGRSSISDAPESMYSRDRSEERDLSSDTLPTSVSPEPDEEDVMSTVEDVIDAYFDELDEVDEQKDYSDEPGDRSSDYSQKDDSKFYHAIGHPSEAAFDTKTADIATSDFLENDVATEHASSAPGTDEAGHPLASTIEPGPTILDPQLNGHKNDRMSARSSMCAAAPDSNVSTANRLQIQPNDAALQRSSEEIPRPASIVSTSRASVYGLPGKKIRVIKRISQTPNKPSMTRQNSGNVHKMQEIHREISTLPELPKQKSRLSRQDWGEIQAYAKRNSKGANIMLKTAIPEEVKSPTKPTVHIPEVDENEAFPRRASTSVFDRKSTLFNLGDIQAVSSPTKTNNSGNVLSPRAGPTVAGLRKAMSHAERDRYGFKKATHNISLQEYDAWAAKYEEHISRRRNKWVALMTKQGLPTTNPTRFPDQNDRVKRYARKGYPPEWRGAMWWYYSGGQYKLQQPEMAGLYSSLVERINNGELNKDDREAIERDLDRTFPDNIHFRPEPTDEELEGAEPQEPLLIKDLREVLSCFALHNPGIGYCQSLNFLAGLLLLFLKQDREKAFVLLTIITQNHLPGAHARSLANTEVNVLMMLIRDYLPKVWASINDTDLVNSGPGSQAHPDSKFQRQPTVALSCTSWFMSIFVGVLPIETVLRVWDAFLYEGPRALYRYALSIFKLGEAEIRKYRPGDGELFMTVQNLPRRCLDPNVLHDLAFVKKGFGSLTQNVIDQKRLFWRDQTERAKRAASQRSKPGVIPEDASNRNGAGLRRRASRRFLRKKNTGL